MDQGSSIIKTSENGFPEEFREFLRDESRKVGYADSITFPRSEEEVIAEMKMTAAAHIPVTIQGGRTGVAAAAVPFGGHVLNMSRMDRLLGMRRENGKYYIRIQPGVVLANLRKALESRKMDTAGWSEESLQVYLDFCRDAEQFFPTDPTETTACLGGMAACNASGARSYQYGAARGHISALRLVMADGDVLTLGRGECLAVGRTLTLMTEGGRQLVIPLPTYQMPHTKNASGYYVEDDMDAIDLVIGSDGTLGVLTELELILSPLPKVIWGVSCFLKEEEMALNFVENVRRCLSSAALEYFDGGALDILRMQKRESTAFASLPDVPEEAECCVYLEFHCEDEEEALQSLYTAGECLIRAGGREEDTWVARNDRDHASLQFFRHAVPESVNMMIDRRRKIDPIITKLAADMSVPDECMHQVMHLYREGLKEYGLESATWGHIGDNHVHVNILPRDGEDYRKGKELCAIWAKEVTAMGGAVSAEHGVGKLKAAFLEVMYGKEHIREMARMKACFDPEWRLGRGNLFPADILAEEVKKEGESCI